MDLGVGGPGVEGIEEFPDLGIGFGLEGFRFIRLRMTIPTDSRLIGFRVLAASVLQLQVKP